MCPLLLIIVLFKIIAQIYLDTNRQVAEPYHEEYKSVAVMFASVVDYEFYESDVDEFNMRDVSIIRLMNEIIGEFDKVRSCIHECICLFRICIQFCSF